MIIIETIRRFLYLEMRILIKISFSFYCLLIALSGFAQPKKQSLKKQPDTNLIKVLLEANPDYFQHILSNPDSFPVQILYTQINRNKKNKPSFTEYSFHLNKQQYFYPASTVKMPIAFLALEKLKELGIPGLDRNSTMITDSSAEGQDVVYTHPLAQDSRPTIAHYIKQIFLVSDNDAFNRLYEFLGQEYIQKKLSEKGYPEMIIRHRLNIYRTPEQNRHTNPVSFYDTAGNLLYQQKGQYSKAIFPVRNDKLGNGYYSNGVLVNGAFDFSEKNRVYLQDQHHILQSLLFPESVKPSQRFNLSEDDYVFLRHWMSAFPKESDYPYYDATQYWDAYCKFLLYGSEKGPVASHIRIFNKVGDAYGFLTDISYVVDFENKVEYMLSATIACNSDGIFNDDAYDYERIGYPFMKNLGKLIYEQELKRKRKFVPDLQKFKIAY